MSPPTEIAGRYELGRRLGAGGMSTVFQANDSVLERPVAVKLLAEHLADDEDFVYRFRREALSAARLQHPNIVQVFEIGEHNGQPYFSLEFCHGGALSGRLRGKPIDARKATASLRKTGRSRLDSAHDSWSARHLVQRKR